MMNNIKFKMVISPVLFPCLGVLCYILNSKKAISAFDDNVIENNKPLPIPIHKKEVESNTQPKIHKKEVVGYNALPEFIKGISIEGSTTSNNSVFNNKAVAESIINAIMQHDSLKSFNVSSCVTNSNLLCEIVQSLTCMEMENDPTDYERISLQFRAPKDLGIKVAGNFNITFDNGIFSWRLLNCQMRKETPIYSY